ncbi:MAG: prolipoprotein diacylglyceryl transferase [Alphaproteobacteria bacterium]|nr:prolipoprotein diacylglyceryl transferase [Alphaproteobacteria bacterium]
MALDFPSIDPVAITLGPLQIRWYGLAYLAGFILGWRYALYLSTLEKERKPSREDIDDFIPWAVLGVVFGGRLGYVLFYKFSYYMANPLEILQIWQGGMSFHGGALGVIVALVIYSARRGIALLRMSDIVCCAVPIGLFFGRIANFINGELYGRVSDVPWAMVFPGGGDQPRHPSQIYEALLEGLVLFAVLCALAHLKQVRSRPGFLTGMFLMDYAFFRMVAEHFREPDSYLGFIWSGISMGQILSVPMMALGACVIAYALRNRKSNG